MQRRSNRPMFLYFSLSLHGKKYCHSFACFMLLGELYRLGSKYIKTFIASVFSPFTNYILDYFFPLRFQNFLSRKSIK